MMCHLNFRAKIQTKLALLATILEKTKEYVSK